MKQSLTGTLIAQFQQGSRPVFRVAAVVGKRAPIVADAAQLALAEASATGLGAYRPLSEKPGGAGLGGTGPRGQGAQLLWTFPGGTTLGVQTHHLSLLHASSTGLGARTPLPQGPLGSTHLSDGIDGLAAASIVVGG